MLEKARGLPLAEVVVDLEDAVLPARKQEALALTLAALADGFAAGRVAVRVNQLGSPWYESELAALIDASARPDSVVVPKAQAGDALREVATRIPVQALVETARGVRDAEELAAVPGVRSLIIGYADLAVSVGRSAVGAADLDLWLATQDRVLMAARAAGVRAIDGPFLGIDDLPGLERGARRAADLGFDGKWAIHPAQVDAIAAAFMPTAQAVAHARAVVTALAEAELAGSGAAQVGGVMIDEPVRVAALRTLARAGEAAA
jgi:citrate lyase beta subunit